MERLGKPEEHILNIDNVHISYGSHDVVHSTSLSMREKAVYALIGPSGCGKSTLLRSINRMNDFVAGFSLRGEIRFRGKNVYDRGVDPCVVRRRIGMVFQKPNPFPHSIAKNITWGPAINGFKADPEELVETSLKRAALWDEVKDRLNVSGLSLSGGQQQRLCIARTIAMAPDVVLMDEPCASLDPISTAKIEELIKELKKTLTIVIVTHNMQQAMRVADYTAFMYQGEVVEYNRTAEVFNNAKMALTREYITGKFG